MEKKMIPELKETGCDVNWIHLAQEPVAGACKHGNEASCSVEGGKLLERTVVSPNSLVRHQAPKKHGITNFL
jgi:hypothetical protein